uniref:putative F-box protein At3g16210 n=1 Tax=Erigeron canadensis TaxID=72917 RepID=UPI001CB9563C|nr:putative F-box protein At3g16210 [Erigeron canadensis]
MSDNISFEIQMEIIERIPDIKWVIQYRSVSKAWKSVIDSKKFVTAHTLRHHQAHNNRHHLLIRTQDCQDCKGCTGTRPISEHCIDTPVKYFSIVDDDVTFPHEKVSVPDSVEELFRYEAVIVGVCHGLFCLYEYSRTAVIWNPSLTKTVVIPVSNVDRCMTDVGFRVCPRNLDPKLVKITRVDDVNVGPQVEVFSLSSGGTWRSPLGSNVPDRSIEFGYGQVVVDEFIYWFAFDRINVDDDTFRIRNPNLIMSFDLTSEEFTKVDLPDSLALDNPHTGVSLYNLRESLVVLERESDRFYSRKLYHVWMMIGHGCARSFNKLYSINASPDVALVHSILGFRNTGAPIVEVDNDKEHYYPHERALAVYDPESKSNTNIGIYGLYCSFSVHSYMETLLLLDNQDLGQR